MQPSQGKKKTNQKTRRHAGSWRERSGAALSLTQSLRTHLHAKGEGDFSGGGILVSQFFCILSSKLRTGINRKQTVFVCSILQNKGAKSWYIFTTTTANRASGSTMIHSQIWSLRCNFSNTQLLTPIIHWLPLFSPLKRKKKRCHQHVEVNKKEQHCSNARA